MRSVRETPTEYVVPSAQETEQAKESSRLLARRIQRGHSLSVRVVNDTPQEQEVVIRLPAKAVQLLQTILVQMAEGKAVTIIPTHAEITTQQAADILNVSRPFFVRLIERGDISFRKVGTHRRVLLSDVMVYKQRTDNAREQSLDELTALSQELNLGY
ncbi:helix-turn-helix domain-containing protein [Chloroflexales bacterium ZM16-3]|nr:helix-turn-helix domain-containing protein [Chloroflexales bacterium ZM16-3]